MELSGPGVQYIADNQLVRRLTLTIYIDYFLNTGRRYGRVDVIVNLNITNFSCKAYSAKGFLLIAIMRSAAICRFLEARLLNVTIRSQLTNIVRGSLANFHPRSLFCSFTSRIITNMFKNSALGYVKRIHTDAANLLNTLACEKIDPWWFTGFIDGEGCFHLSFTSSKKHKLG